MSQSIFFSKQYEPRLFYLFEPVWISSRQEKKRVCLTLDFYTGRSFQYFMSEVPTFLEVLNAIKRHFIFSFTINLEQRMHFCIIYAFGPNPVWHYIDPFFFFFTTTFYCFWSPMTHVDNMPWICHFMSYELFLHFDYLQMLLIDNDTTVQSQRKSLFWKCKHIILNCHASNLNVLSVCALLFILSVWHLMHFGESIVDVAYNKPSITFVR